MRNHKFKSFGHFNLGSSGPTIKMNLARNLPVQVLNNILDRELRLIFEMDDFMNGNDRYLSRMSFIDFCKREGLRCYTRNCPHYEYIRLEDIVLDEDSVLVYEMEMDFKYTKNWRKHQIEQIHLAYNHINILMIRGALKEFYPDVSDEEWYTREWV